MILPVKKRHLPDLQEAKIGSGTELEAFKLDDDEDLAYLFEDFDYLSILY